MTAAVTSAHLLRLPAHALLSDPDVKRSYAVDSSLGAVEPTSYQVVRAESLADVVEVLTFAQRTGTPVVPQGARTGLCGGAVATEGAIVLNVEALDAIEEIDPVEGIVVAGPGVITGQLKAAVAEHGLFYPPDPASADSCTLGGNVATNAGGLCCVKYGVTADYIRGLQVALPGGEVITTGRRTSKGVTGLDLTGLMVGSEGTLGVVTKVIATLVPAPEPALTALATFDSLAATSEAIVALRRLPQRPSLLEFLDGPSLAAIQALADFGFPDDCAAALLVQSDRHGFAAQDVQLYAEVMARAGAVEVAVADTKMEGDMLLAGRRMLNAALEALGPRYIEDMCVPIRGLADLVIGGQAIGDRLGVRVTMSGHGGDGNLHPSIFFDPADPDSAARARQAFDEMVRLTLELGGTIAGEHGIGTLKRPWIELEVGAASMARQRQLKAVFDPRGIMNPGKVL
jgi:glycolate oxidase